MAGKMTLAEVEAKARQLIRQACPEGLMEIVSFATDRQSGHIFIVLSCSAAKATEPAPD